MDYGIANRTGKPKSKEIEQIVYTAKENDIWFYDTAQGYGASEQELGLAFSKININEQVKCITKLHPSFAFNSFYDLQRNVQESLDKLNINCLWGLLIHRPNIVGQWNNLLDGVDRLKKLNLIKYFGVSVYKPEDAKRFAIDKYIDVIQVPFNVMDRRLIDNNFFDVARKNNKRIFIRSIFLQGLLLMNKKQLIDKQMGWTLEYMNLLLDFVQSRSLDLQTFSLNAVLKKIPYANFIIGIESADQLKQNLDSILVNEFPVEDDFFEWWSKLPILPQTLLDPSLWPKTV